MNTSAFLNGKVAAVTGAGAGIGKATAKLLATAGARVALIGRTREEPEQTRTEQLRAPFNFPAGQIPLTRGKSGSAEQVAQLDGFLVSDAASHITRTEVFIDGAQSLLQG